MRIFNITDITEGRGRPLRVLGRVLKVRGSAPLPVEQYKRLKPKLDRMIKGGFIFVGDALPPSLLKRRTLLRKKPHAVRPVPEQEPEAVEETPLEKATPNVELRDDLVGRVQAGKLLKKQIVKAVEELGLDSDGKKEALATKLIDELSGRPTEDLPLEVLDDLLALKE